MLKLECSTCGMRPHREGQRTCNQCHAAWFREWRKTHKLTGEAKFKANVRSYTKSLVRRGKITKLPCEVCGIEKVEAHHEDYTKPHQVKWLCFKHHRQLHKEVKVIPDQKFFVEHVSQ